MTRYWLRVEAQNLSSFILDTQDLSTARGGSLALLDIIDEVGLALSAIADVEVVTTGASTGVWRFSAESDEAAEAIAASVRRQLAGGGGELRRAARHATFRVVVVPQTAPLHTTPLDRRSVAESFLRDGNTLLAIARRRQLSSAGLVYPTLEQPESARVCEIDRVRPAAPSDIRIGGVETAVSRSVADRRRYGVQAKQKFYAKLFEQADASRSRRPADALVEAIAGNAPFALQLGSISETSLPGRGTDRRLRPALAGKVCILYMDGNDFGRLQDAFVASGNDPLARQQEFDSRLREHRRNLLAAILGRLVVPGASDGPPARGEPCDAEYDVRYGRDADNVIRFETLLWGGDEMMFAMPARFGWEIAELICETTATWTVEIGKETRPMHHAIGLVFCHHDAPISRIRALARDLADRAKEIELVRERGVADEPEKITGRDLTLVVPFVLESFDHVGDDLSAFLDRRSPPDRRIGRSSDDAQRSVRDRAFALTPLELAALRKLAVAAAGRIDTLEPLSRRRLRRLARAIHLGGQSGRFSVEGLLADAPKWLRDAHGGGASMPHGDLFTGADRDRAFWLLEDNWDYLLPIEADAGAAA